MGVLVRRARPKKPGGWRTIKRDSLRELWAKVVKTRDGFRCRRCPRTKAQGFQMQAAHVLGAGAHPSIKYNSSNGVTLCAICHDWFDTHKSSKRDGEADQWVRGAIGIDRYMRLLVLANISKHVDKLMIRLTLREELKQLGAA